jgi:hypothetical protein
MTNHDIKGANFDEDDGGFITADSSAKARIHVHHLAVIRFGKAALVKAIEAGAVLQEERSRRGDDFGDWVDTQLGLSRDEADCYIRFYEESPVRPEQLSPAVEVKLPGVLELLGQLHTTYGTGAAETRTGKKADGPKRSQPKVTVDAGIDSTPNQQVSKPTGVAEQLVKAKERARKSTPKDTAKAKPVPKDRDGRNTALTAEQQKYLIRRSPKLFAQVRRGELPVEEALRLAGGLPDRSSPERSPSR